MCRIRQYYIVTIRRYAVSVQHATAVQSVYFAQISVVCVYCSVGMVEYHTYVLRVKSFYLMEEKVACLMIR